MVRQYSTTNAGRVLLIGSGVVLAAILCVYLPGWMTAYVRATILEYQEHVRADQLFFRAHEGDKKAIGDLADFQSRYANQLLRRLFFDQSSSADRRSVALALKKNGALQDFEITPLLALDRFPADRKAAVAVFEKYGCDQECVWAAVRLLQSLRAGGQTAYEKEFSRLIHTPHAQQYAAEDHNDAEAACKRLLLSNPCEALRVLSRKPEEKLAVALERELGVQQSCK